MGTAEYQVAPCAAESRPERARREAPRRDHAAAGRQRRERRGDESMHVEERHHAVARVLGGEPVGGGDGARGGRQVALADRHALGLARRAARVQEQRDRLGVAGRRRADRCRIAESQPRRGLTRDLELRDAERLAGRARRALLTAQEEHRPRPQVVEVGVELVCGVGLVERGGGRARGDDAEEGGDDLGPVRQAHRDRVARSGARRGEPTGEPVGRRAQLPVGRALAARGLDQRERGVRRRQQVEQLHAIPCRRRQLPASTSCPMPVACAGVSQRRSTAVVSTRSSASRATWAENHATSGSLASSEP